MSDWKLCLIAIKIALFVFSWMMDGVAFGQTYKISVDVQSCSVVACKRATQMGSAACIGKIGTEYIFVSAGHVCWNLDDPLFSASSKPLGVKIEDAEGRQFPARIIAYSDHASPNDLAYIGLDERHVNGPVKAYPLAEREPPAGSDVKIYGYPSGAKYNEINSTIQRVALNSIVQTSPLDPGRPTGDLYIVPATVGGNSGGPVVFNGQLVGVISCTGGGHSVASGVTRIRASLVRVFKRLPDVGTVAQKPIASADSKWSEDRDHVAIQVFGAEWCEPCKSMRPILEQLKTEGVTIYYIDVDREPKAVRTFDVRSIPTYIAYNEGNLGESYQARLTGVVSIERLRELVASALRTPRKLVPRLPIVTDPDCARPAPTQPQPTTPPIEAEKPPAANPAPIPEVIHGRDGKDGKDGAPGKDAKIDVAPLLDAIAGLRAEIEVLKNRKLPDIPVEIWDEETGKMIDRRVVPLGGAIQLGNRSKKVK